MRHVWISCLIAALLPSTAVAHGLRADAAVADITPPVGYPLWGYASRHDSPSTGIHDRLHARVLVLATDDERIAIVSLDLGRAPTRQSTAAIRARVKNEAGIQHVFLVASHTHHGPVIELDNWPSPQDSYVRHLETTIVELIADAARHLRPARLGIATRQVSLNGNRHCRRSDAPVDRELLVLRVEDDKGAVIAHAVNFAAHATMLDRHVLEISADYPGTLAAAVESETKAPCLFLQGAAGDLTTNSDLAPGPLEFGQLLARQVMEMSRTIHCRGSAEPAMQVREEDFRFRSRVDHQDKGIQVLFAFTFFPALVDFYVNEYQAGIRPHLTVALINNSIGLVGVSGEFFCGHSLSLKRRAHLEHVFFLGYCNDYQQYFPTIEAAAQGGYGADPQVAPVEVGAGERMIDRALIHLYTMRGQLPDLNPKK